MGPGPPGTASRTVEEPSQPAAEKEDHARVAVREAKGAIPLGAFPRVQRDPRHQELALPALGDQPVDLGQRQPGPPQLARLLPLGELAPVAHGRILA